jgi:hypothetical protein
MKVAQQMIDVANQDFVHQNRHGLYADYWEYSYQNEMRNLSYFADLLEWRTDYDSKF